jgi:hypothetical protein
MPAYQANQLTNSPLTAIYPGDAGFPVINNENPATGFKSQEVALGEPYGEGGIHQLYASAAFASAPVAVSWKIQHAAKDTDSAYTDIAGASSTNVAGDNVPFTTPLPFVRMVIVTGPGVNMTGLIGKK